MDRVTEYFGALVRETDGLQAQQNTMKALGWLTQAALGPPPFVGNPFVSVTQNPLPSFVTAVDGFACTPTTPASLSIILQPGQIYALASLEATVWSSLSSNTAQQIAKQGIMALPDTITITPPGTSGFSQVFLIEVQYADLDANPVLLPYYNAANPSVAFSGPNNSGQSQNTVRQGIVAVQIKAGIAATTGTQTAPAVDAGWTGLFNITVANGQSTITSSSIAPILSAPWVAAKLPTIPSSMVNNAWAYAVDTGVVNAYVASIWPAPTTLVPGTEVKVKIGITNTGASTFNLNGLGAASILRGNLGALAANDLTAGSIVSLIFDGTNWQIQNYIGLGSGTITQNFFTGLPFAVDTGTASALVGPFSPAITSGQYVAGLTVLVQAAHNCPGGVVTFQPNSLTAHGVTDFDGAVLNPGDWVAGEILELIYNGSSWSLINVRAPSAPLKKLVVTGSGQALPSQVQTQVTCLTTVSQNTLINSTWNGNTLTVGAGEDGLWAFDANLQLGPVPAGNGNLGLCVLTINQIRSSVVIFSEPMIESGSAISSQAVAGGSAQPAGGGFVLDLQVGDQVQFFAFVTWGGFAATLPIQPGAYIQAYRVTGLH